MARRRKLGTTFPANATKASFPVRLDVQLAEQVDIAPDGDRWLHEIKFDGYRLVGFRDGNRVWLRTRKMLDWTKRFPEIVAAILALPNDQFVIDGEVVAQLPSGVSSFSELQQTLSAGTSGKLVYEVFDLLYLSGQSLSNVPLLERKQNLHELVHSVPTGRIRYVDHVVGDGPIFYEQCRKLGLEGVVSKRADGTYVKGRTATWLKVKAIQRDDFVIGGYTLSKSRRRGLGALLVGTRSTEDLQYVGSVGSGLSEVTIANLLSSLEKLEAPQSPFANYGPRQAERGTRWIRPELVAAVQYSGHTTEGRLRHPVFLGLRDDLRASDIVMEPETVAPENTSPVPRLSTRQRTELERVELTNPGRVLYPAEGITKIQVVQYYAAIADRILPHVVNRPLSLVRCPEGVDKPCFYQKHSAAGTPESIRRIEIREEKNVEVYLAIDDLAGLLSLVQISVLEIHPWGARVDEVDRPDRIVFDLDPDEALPWTRVIAAALELRDRLQTLGLESFLKMTGGKGLHVVVPIQRRSTWDEVKAFSNALAVAMAGDSPKEFTTSIAKAARPGRIFIDYLRNRRGSTSIAAYSTRARPGAPVSAPLGWEELSPAIRGDHFTIVNLPGRLNAMSTDPWESMSQLKQRLTAGMLKALTKRV